MEEVDFDFEAAFRKVENGEQARKVERLRIEEEMLKFVNFLKAKKKELQGALEKNCSMFSCFVCFVRVCASLCHSYVLGMITSNPTLTRFVTIQTVYSYFKDGYYKQDNIAEVSVKDFDLNSVDEKYSYRVVFSYKAQKKVE